MNRHASSPSGRRAIKRLAALSLGLLTTPLMLSAQTGESRPASTTPPVLGPARALVLPQMSEKTLANGLKLVVVERHELPIIDATLVIRTGAEADGVARGGLAGITASMLDRGAGSRDAMELAEEIGYLAISLRSGAGFESSTISLHTTRATLDSAMHLMADLTLRPAFSGQEFERLKSERLTSLLQEQDRGPALATRAFSTMVFGPQHPYGRSVSGSSETVESITLGDVQKFWEQWYRPNNATLVIVGDLGLSEAEALAQREFGAWQKATLPPSPAYPSTRQAPRPTTVTIIDKPGAAQSSFRIGGVGVARNTADYYPLMVMNTALGGSFTSRLNNTLREKKGYTYGASSSFTMRREAGPFTASAEVVSAKTDSALIEFMNELKSIRSPMPQEELERAKRYLQLGYAGRFESNSSIASQIAALIPYDLPLSTLGAYDQGVGKVSAADVQRVATRYIDIDHFVIVIAGDRASIEPALKATGVAPVEIGSVDGRVMKEP